MNIKHPTMLLNATLAALLVAAISSVCLPAAPAPEAPKTGVLIVTGIDHPAHKWRETAPALKQLIELDARMEARVVEDPGFLDSASLTNYAVVLLHFQNWQKPGPGAAARENLMRYVANGGGLVSVHFACGAWHGEWPEFVDLIGRVWFGPKGGKQHDPLGVFTVRITDKNHPITKGINDFETNDELYTCLTGDKPIQLLAQATSKVDQKDHPMAFVREYGKGRVFLTTLGHHVIGLTNACVPQFLQQGCAWAAGLPSAAEKK